MPLGAAFQDAVMRLLDGELVVSPIDLTKSDHLTRLDLEVARGPHAKPPQEERIWRSSSGAAWTTRRHTSSRWSTAGSRWSRSRWMGMIGRLCRQLRQRRCD